jgi:phosphohistidine phosphatase
VAAFVADQVASGAGPAPDHVLSSTAARARATAEPVHAALASGVALELEPALYGADPDDIIDRLRLLPDTVGTVMVVGHNPTFHELALLLLSSDDTDGRRRLEAGFPTAALALVALDVTDWSAAAPGSGHLEELFLPTR